MEKLNCIVIEDSISAQRILEKYIADVSFLQLQGLYIDPLEAFEILEAIPIDIIFLDIHLPKLSGIDFLKNLVQKPTIILTTAFTEYALEGYELDVMDFLLKPFSFDRFLKAVLKAKTSIKRHQNTVPTSIFIREKGGIEKVAIKQILFLESKGDYTIIHTTGKKYIVSKTIKEILALNQTDLLRCHKSYAIHIHAIDRIVGNIINIKNKEIPIGRTYKNDLFTRLNLI